MIAILCFSLGFQLKQHCFSGETFLCTLNQGKCAVEFIRCDALGNLSDDLLDNPAAPHFFLTLHRVLVQLLRFGICGVDLQGRAQILDGFCILAGAQLISRGIAELPARAILGRPLGLLNDPCTFVAEIGIAFIELKRFIDQFARSAEVVALASFTGLLKERGDFVSLLLQFASVFDFVRELGMRPVDRGRLIVELKGFRVFLRQDRLVAVRQQLPKLNRFLLARELFLHFAQ